MSRLPLLGGAYQARSPVSAAQQQLNLYTEPLPKDAGEPSQSALYPTPGLGLFATLPTGPVRGIYQAAARPDMVYAVGGSVVYSIGVGPLITALGNITVGKTTPVSMSDNQLQLVIVDGSTNGWAITLATNAFAAIVSANFFGADRVTYLNTYFLFNKPGTNIFYWSDSLAITFTALAFASKTSYSDNVVGVVASKGEAWVIGQRASEVWFNTSTDPLSFFDRVDGTFIDQGCVAVYSIAEIDNSVFFLSYDRHGQGIVLQASGYQTKRISTFAIENEIANIVTGPADTIGWTYQLNGHAFYVLTFPVLDKSYAYDLTTQLWHQWGWRNPAGGAIHRHRGMCSFQGFGFALVGDWQTGKIYQLQTSVLTDNGDPIQRLKSFPHIEDDDGNRVSFRQFIANVATGTALSGTPTISLDWSDDYGRTFGTPVVQSLGLPGAFKTQAQWQRLGLARSRVFRVSWTDPVDTALLGGFVDVVDGTS